VTDIAIRAAAGSDIGSRYQANFDVMHLRTNPLLAVVADGMGAGAGSARAGKTAVGTFVEQIDTAGEQLGPAALRDAIALAQRQVGNIGRELGELAGCTLTALVASGGDHWIVQIGDSRIYRLRDELLELLTVDHTMAWLGAVHGWYPFHSAQAAAARYQLTRYIGHFGEPEPDVMSVSVRPGDVFLLCSDGVAEQVSYEDMRILLGQQTDPHAVVANLLAAAAAAGGNDNATAVVISFSAAR
jgi:serine/threonine protein phosphatase PrpC